MPLNTRLTLPAYVAETSLPTVSRPRRVRTSVLRPRGLSQVLPDTATSESASAPDAATRALAAARIAAPAGQRAGARVADQDTPKQSIGDWTPERPGDASPARGVQQIGPGWRAGGGVRTSSDDAARLLRAFESSSDMTGYRDWYAWLASRTAVREGQLVWGQAQREHEPEVVEYQGIRIPRSILDTLSSAEVQAIRHLHRQWELDGVPRNDFHGCYTAWLQERRLEPFALAYFQRLESSAAAGAPAAGDADGGDAAALGSVAVMRELLDRLQQTSQQLDSATGPHRTDNAVSLHEMARQCPAAPQLPAAPVQQDADVSHAQCVEAGLSQQPWGRGCAQSPQAGEPSSAA